MILHAVELTYVGRFRDPLRLGPFARGLTILAAPNEAGKSTVLRAIARTLFDKHTTKGDELKSLQPAGTELAPRIAVEFETSSGRYRIEKTFLQAPRSLLKAWQSGTWQPVAEADLADQRVQELLQSTLPGRGATRPEHWGLLGFLFSRQGERVEWPTLDDEAVGQRIRAKLARVEIDPVIEKLRQRLGDDADAIITSTGQPKTGGILRAADDEIAAVDGELVQLRRIRSELEGAQQKYRDAGAQVTALEQEHQTRSADAHTASERAQSAERVRVDLDVRTSELTAARERLRVVTTDAVQVEQRIREIATAKIDLEKSTTHVRQSEATAAALRVRLDAMQSARPALEETWTRSRAVHQRATDLLKSRELIAHSSALKEQETLVATTATKIEILRKQLAQLPALTPAKVRTFEEMADTLRALTAQLEAVGLTVELVPEHATTITTNDGAGPRETALRKDTPQVLRSAQFLDLRLTGWGKLTVRSGAKETQTVSRDLADTAKRLKEGLGSEGVTSVQEARDALAQRKDFSAQLTAAEMLLGEQHSGHASPASFREALARATLRAEAFAKTLQATPEEFAETRTQLETAEARAAEQAPAAERVLKAADAALTQLRTEEREAGIAVQRLTQAAHTDALRVRTLESQVAEASTRYPDGLESAKTAAQIAFTEAEARVAALRAKLPPDFERLPERNRLATTKLQSVIVELQTRRGERDQAKGALETFGSQGLYSRETDLEEKKAEATLRRDAARTQGWTSRIAHDLIEYRKGAATRAVLLPLEQRLTAAFAELTGVTSRQVFLEENLQIAGVGPTRESAHRFDLLSQGAKEQLVLCLRIAVAQELATQEPQVLILDDVLVNTDSSRQIRILEVLTSLAKDLQIIVLTCHADRYREAGHSLTLPL